MRSRIRSIKPEVLADEKLWDLEQSSGLPLYRSFTGLWMYSDREGRFEWRPRTLRSFILPHSDCDFDRVLDALASIGLVVKYEADGRVYGWVKNFRKHQTPNAREPASTIPPPHVHACAAHVQEDDGSSARTKEKVSSGNGSWERNGNGSVECDALDTPITAILPVSPANDAERRETTSQYVRQFHAELMACIASFPSPSKPTADACVTLTKWANQFPNPRRALQAAFLGFRDDPWALEKKYPIGALANSTAKYHAPGLEILAAVEADKAANQ